MQNTPAPAPGQASSGASAPSPAQSSSSNSSSNSNSSSSSNSGGGGFGPDTSGGNYQTVLVSAQYDPGTAALLGNVVGNLSNTIMAGTNLSVCLRSDDWTAERAGKKSAKLALISRNVPNSDAVSTTGASDTLASCYCCFVLHAAHEPVNVHRKSDFSDCLYGGGVVGSLRISSSYLADL